MWEKAQLEVWMQALSIPLEQGSIRWTSTIRVSSHSSRISNSYHRGITSRGNSKLQWKMSCNSRWLIRPRSWWGVGQQHSTNKKVVVSDSKSSISTFQTRKLKWRRILKSAIWASVMLDKCKWLQGKIISESVTLNVSTFKSTQGMNNNPLSLQSRRQVTLFNQEEVLHRKYSSHSIQATMSKLALKELAGKGQVPWGVTLLE